LVPASQRIFAISGPELVFLALHCPGMIAALTAPGRKEGKTMLSWVVTFLIIALIAGVLGFGGIAGASVEIAKVIFFIAVVLFLISAVVGLVRGRSNV
jgi:uncharacterized membrane protein YtjA (UPF0391 family)